MRKMGILVFAALLAWAPLAHAGDAPAAHKKPVTKAHGTVHHPASTKSHAVHTNKAQRAPTSHAPKGSATAKGKKVHGAAQATAKHPTAKVN